MEIVQQYMVYLMCHILPLQLIVDGGCNGKLGFERFNWAEIVMCYTSFIGIFNNCMSCYFQVTPPRSGYPWNVKYQTTTIQILYIKTSQNLMSRFSTNVQLPGVRKQGIVLPVTSQWQLQMSRSEWRKMRDEYFWADGLVSLTGHLTAQWSVYRDLKSSRQVDMHMIQLVLSWCWFNAGFNGVCSESTNVIHCLIISLSGKSSNLNLTRFRLWSKKILIFIQLETKHLQILMFKHKITLFSTMWF